MNRENRHLASAALNPVANWHFKAHSNLLRSVVLDRVLDGSVGLSRRGSLQLLDVASLGDLVGSSLLLAGGQDDALAGWVG